jgi:hypothetical protein
VRCLLGALERERQHPLAEVEAAVVGVEELELLVDVVGRRGTGSQVVLVPLGRGPRQFCRFCTPRSDEDRAAARAHWAHLYAERARVRNATAREQLCDLPRR